MPAVNPYEFENDQTCYDSPTNQSIPKGSRHFITSVIFT
jgi:hypothetical protein